MFCLNKHRPPTRHPPPATHHQYVTMSPRCTSSLLLSLLLLASRIFSLTLNLARRSYRPSFNVWACLASVLLSPPPSSSHLSGPVLLPSFSLPTSPPLSSAFLLSPWSFDAPPPLPPSVSGAVKISIRFMHILSFILQSPLFTHTHTNTHTHTQYIRLICHLQTNSSAAYNCHEIWMQIAFSLLSFYSVLLRRFILPSIGTVPL